MIQKRCNVDKAPISLESAWHKFNGTMPYCAGPHYFFTNFSDFISNLKIAPPHSMFGLWSSSAPEKLDIRGTRLIEVVSYDDGSIHLFVLKEADSRTYLTFPNTAEPKQIQGVTIGFICTADEPYLSILRDSISWYKKELPGDVEISVVLFGDADLPADIKVHREPIEKFSMAYARNLCLANASHDHMFLLDVDIRMSTEQFNRIIQRYQNTPNHGVFNLKNDPHIGNGLYFGNRHLMLSNGYDERFQKFWREDTEHLMNYSRMGIVPMVVFEPFHRVDHSREKTLSSGLHELNFNLMSNILNNGTR